MSTKYAILFHPRSGSSLLANLCCNEPHIVNYYEALSIESARSAHLLTAQEEQNFTYLIQSAIIRRISKRAEGFPHTVVGFKFAPYQCLSAPTVISDLLAYDFKIVCLSRRSLVDTAVSQLAARALEKKSSPANLVYDGNDKEEWAERNRVKSFTADLEAFNYYLLDAALQRDQVNLIAKFFPRERRFSLVYEELMADPKYWLGKLSNFLEAPTLPLAHASVLKHIAAPLEQLIENYADLQANIQSPFVQSILSRFDSTAFHSEGLKREVARGP